MLATQIIQAEQHCIGRARVHLIFLVFAAFLRSLDLEIPCGLPECSAFILVRERVDFCLSVVTRGAGLRVCCLSKRPAIRTLRRGAKEYWEVAEVAELGASPANLRLLRKGSFDSCWNNTSTSISSCGLVSRARRRTCARSWGLVPFLLDFDTLEEWTGPVTDCDVARFAPRLAFLSNLSWRVLGTNTLGTGLGLRAVLAPFLCGASYRSQRSTAYQNGDDPTAASMQKS